MDANTPLKKIKVDLEDLGSAMSSGNNAANSFLDRETGLIIPVTDDMLMLLEEVIGEMPQNDRTDAAAVKAALDAGDLSDPEKEETYAAFLCKSDGERRYVRIPAIGSARGFKEMEEFVDGVSDSRVAYQLRMALRGQRPFRQFKDALGHYPKVRQAWLDYHNTSLKRAGIEWLASIGFEPE